MTRKETRWLTSVVMSFVMLVTLIGSPLTAMAAENTLDDDSEIIYVNSDGEEVPAKLDADGFCYRVINSDGYDAVEVLGIKGAKGMLTIPDKIDELEVTSFAIDPRWPVWDEIYDDVTGISLPKTIKYAHSSYMEEFLGLKSVSIAEGGAYYMSQGGVLFKYNDDGCQVAHYPVNNPSKTFVMPSDMNKYYEFFDGCPVESITISRSFPLFKSPNPLDFPYLENLKEIIVEEGNKYYEAENGILYKIDNNKKELIIYPQAKEDDTYNIPADVTGLGEDSLCNNTYIKTIVINSNSLEISDDAFWGNESINTIEFKHDEAPAAEDYEHFAGVKKFYEERGEELTIKTPDTAEYKDFVGWIKGKNFNYWIDNPERKYDKIPLGSNREPVSGTAAYGEAYNVYSNDENGPYTKTRPNEAGIWYAKLIVDDGSDHTGLESEPFEFTVEHSDITENTFLDIPGDNENIVTEYGKGFVVKATPLYGKVDKIEYKDTKNASASWTTKKPTKPGTYEYWITVNGVSGKYDSLEFISKDHNCFIIINKASVRVEVYCDDIAFGDTPEPDFVLFDDDKYAEFINEDKIYFKYYDKDDSNDETPLDPKNLPVGQYKIKAYYNDPLYTVTTVSIEYEDEDVYFKVLSKLDFIIEKLDEITSINDLTSDDELLVNRIKAAYDSLTDAEKDEISEHYKEKLDIVVKRMDTLVAYDVLEEKEENYYDALDEYNEAVKDAAESKKDAEKASAGQAAITAAQRAKRFADAAVKAATILKKAADSLKTAAKNAYLAAMADSLMTKLDRQKAENYYKSVSTTQEQAKLKLADAKTAQTKAVSFAKSVQAKTAKAAKSYKVSGLKVKALKGKKAKITWKANKKASGYQIQYSLKKSMKKAKKLTVKKATIKKATAKKLKKGKKYYFRIRTFIKYKDIKTGKTKTIYGKWSGKKAIKAK